MSSDNELAVSLNDHLTDIRHSSEQFRELKEFMITRDFVAGINTLKFVVTNTESEGEINPTALLVANLRGQAREAP